MRFLAASWLALFLLATPAVAQLSRLGASVPKSVQSYFGIARRMDDVDSLHVVLSNGVLFIGIRNGVAVDTTSFTEDELPILERYLRDYETLLSSKTDAFINDTAMRRILGRVSPRRCHNPEIRPITVRLLNGNTRTGIPLATSDDDLLISDSLTFSPLVHLPSKSFTCIHTSLIESITDDVSSESPIWYRVDGNVLQYRSAMELACPERAYVAGIPPEFAVCIKDLQDVLGPGASLALVCPRRKGWSFAGHAGFLSTKKKPTAEVKNTYSGPDGSPLQFQSLTYSFGLDASVAIGTFFDLGLRGTLNAQPSTIDDDLLQNSLGMDEFLLQVLGTWHILAIDEVGYRKLGVSTTLGVGPSYQSFRTRTYRNIYNLTSTGSGLAVDATWNLQLMYSVSRAITVGLRGTATYQYGLSSSFDDIVWPNVSGSPWTAVFSMTDQSASYLGVQLVVAYTLP